MNLTELCDWYEGEIERLKAKEANAHRQWMDADKEMVERGRQNALLRRLLWEAHPCVGKYGDDGELQCNECLIDFKRDPVEVIEKRIAERGMRELKKAGAVPCEHGYPQTVRCSRCGE